MSSFFAPYCIKPVYMLDSSNKAGNCGFINGIVYSFIFTIIIIIAGIKFYISYENNNRKYIVYGLGAIISIIWIIVPIFLYYSRKTIWKGYDDSKKELRSQGYNKMEILNILQLFEQGSASLNVRLPGTSGLVFAKEQQSQISNKNEENK